MVAGATRTFPMRTSAGTQMSAGIVWEIGLSQDLRTDREVGREQVTGDREKSKSKAKVVGLPLFPVTCPL
jgi:hypothetical protein